MLSNVILSLFFFFVSPPSLFLRQNGRVGEDRQTDRERVEGEGERERKREREREK